MVEQEIQRFDYIVIGAGSGGIASGRRAAMYGKNVLIIENRVIGGTCVNVGCVPKKVMFNLANFMEESHLFKDYGVCNTGSLQVDFPAFKQARDAYVTRLNGIYKNMLANSNVTYVEGTAHFVSDHVVAVEGKQYGAEHILIASGSYADVGKFPGSNLCMTSDDFFEMSELPKSMICIGGGYIGVEMAQIMAALGVKTTLVVRSTILKQLDRDIIDELMKNMEKLGVEIRLNSPHKAVTQEESGQLCLELPNATFLKADRILVAIGRPPNVEPLQLVNTGVKVERGVVQVDEYQNTSVPGVYAIGDVTDAINLTPVAIRAGRMLSERLFNGKTGLKMLYKNVATIIFSHPPIGTVGMTEAEAKKQFGEENVTVYKTTFTNMFYSLAKDDSKKLSTFFKIVCHGTGPPSAQKIVGIHGLGKGIDEMLQGLSIALTMGATKQDFDNSVAIHPTASEEWVLFNTNYIQ